MQKMRLISAGITLAVVVTLVVRLGLTAHENSTSILDAVWIDCRFFTIWTNTLVGLVSGAIALGRVPPQWLTAGPALAIALVAGVYHALLAAGRNLTGMELAVDMMVHTFIPAAFIIFWTFMLPKDRLAWRDLLIWSAYPIIYSAYAIARGAMDGVYPYFFLDVAQLGVGGVALWVAGLASVFLFAGAAIVLSARRVARTA